MYSMTMHGDFSFVYTNSIYINFSLASVYHFYAIYKTVGNYYSMDVQSRPLNFITALTLTLVSIHIAHSLPQVGCL